MMFKKIKKGYENCIKCGKPLSEREIKEGVPKCENCLGKQAKKTKDIFVGISVVVTAVTGVILLITNRDKKDKF